MKTSKRCCLLSLVLARVLLFLFCNDNNRDDDDNDDDDDDGKINALKISKAATLCLNIGYCKVSFILE